LCGHLVEGTLDPNEVRAIGLSVLPQPGGVSKARSVVIRLLYDRPQKGFAILHPQRTSLLTRSDLRAKGLALD